MPELPSTQWMIGEAQIAAMKPGAILINASRGTVVEIEPLAAAIKAKKLLGAAIDVFPAEPASNAERFVSPLQGCANVILTPHIGGSTEEAQERIGAEVARKLVDYSDIGSTVGAVNFPQVQIPVRANGTRFIHVQRNVPGMLRRLNDVFANRQVNIAAQNYHTDGEVGYAVIEADGVSITEARDILRESPGVVVVDSRNDKGYITPKESQGEFAVYVSRIRNDPTLEHGLNLWVVSDNLRKGAALNAVQIAQLLHERGLIGQKALA